MSFTINKEKGYALFKNKDGEFHFNLDDYNKIGEKEATRLALKGIKKKINSGSYSNATINFDQAKELGFCEYGIKDFCNRLRLDIDGTYSISDLYEKLDVNTFIEYPDECLKLFTNSVFEKFGGIIKILDENRSRRVLNLVINRGNIEDKIFHLLAYHSATRVIVNFEKKFPNDDRPRKAIAAKKDFIDGKIDEKQLLAAESAARSAVWLAAESAAESAARSAESAAESAAWSAARSAELTFQIDTLIKLLREGK